MVMIKNRPVSGNKSTLTFKILSRSGVWILFEMYTHRIYNGTSYETHDEAVHDHVPISSIARLE